MPPAMVSRTIASCASVSAESILNTSASLRVPRELRGLHVSVCRRQGIRERHRSSRPRAHLDADTIRIEHHCPILRSRENLGAHGSVAIDDVLRWMTETVVPAGADDNGR